MRKGDISIFIEEMEEIGDVWEPEDVKRVYGKMSLADALNKRKSELNSFFETLGTVLNR